MASARQTFCLRLSPPGLEKKFAVFGNVTSRGISLRHSAWQHRRSVAAAAADDDDENINDDLGGDAEGDKDDDDERGRRRRDSSSSDDDITTGPNPKTKALVKF